MYAYKLRCVCSYYVQVSCVCMSVAMTAIVAMAKNGSIYIHYHMHAKYAMCL